MSSLNLTFGLELEGFFIYEKDYLDACGLGPLDFAQHLLQQSGNDVRVFKPSSPGAKPIDYSVWQIMPETSVDGLTDNAVLAALSRNGFRAQRHRWEYFALEFVSPPYPIDELRTAVARLTSMLQPLRTRKSVFTTNLSCGLHVHIGIAGGARLPMQLLQNLAFTTLVFEHEFMKLHHPARIRDNPDIRPNRKEFGLGIPGNHELRDQRKDAQGRKLESSAYAIRNIHRRIFDHRQSHRSLRNVMGTSRQKTINWRYSARESTLTLPSTVEFRQHQATDDAEDIGAWTAFCIGLVTFSARTSSEDLLSGITSWCDGIDLRNLLSEMDLDAEPEETLRARYQRGVGRAGHYPVEYDIWRLTRAAQRDRYEAPDWTDEEEELE